MPGVTFDTSIFIARKKKPAKPPAGFLMSVVVIQEIIAGAEDGSEVKKWQATMKEYEKEGRLLVPTAEDWCEAGRVLNSLLRGLKSKSGGITPKLPAGEKQRIIRDVLIARTARRAGALLVTDNIKDFKLIKRFCDVRLMSRSQYFGKS